MSAAALSGARRDDPKHGLETSNQKLAGVTIREKAPAPVGAHSAHPFTDFNGRVSRVWLREILRRLDLPPVQLAPAEEFAREEYLVSLQAADRNDWRPLMNVWRQRFEETTT